VLVEAYMYRAHPQTQAIMDVVRSGAIGQVRMIRTSFCFRVRQTQGNIRFNPAMAGGALMDIGGYCISFSHLIAGQAPSSAHAIASLHPSGVDDVVCGTLGYPNGIVASFTCGMSLQADNTAYICGDEGYLQIPWPWKPPGRDAQFQICRNIPTRQDTGGKVEALPPVETRTVNAGKDLYAIEADAFSAVVLDKAPAFMPEEHTLATMQVLDNLRRQVGVV
jgi:D-xylose 1-dehydrogenase (NADP+, D-xylono-1,5-lactone-forming)